jgi:hypothetical protein
LVPKDIQISKKQRFASESTQKRPNSHEKQVQNVTKT